MKVVDRHLAGLFWRMLAGTVTGFVALFLVVDIFEKLRLILKYNPQSKDMAAFFAARIPWMLTQALPMAALLAVLGTLALLARQGEVTALRASGLSLRRLALPFAASGLVLCGIHATLQELAAPRGFALAREIKHVRIKGLPARSLLRRSDLWLRTDRGVLHVDRIGRDERELLGVQVVELEGNRVVRRLDARRAVWSGGGWVLEGVEDRSFGRQGSFAVRTRDRLSHALGVSPEDLRIERQPPEAMTWKEIRDRIRRHRARGLDVTELEVGLWAKTSLPFACAILPLLAFPLGARIRPRGGVARPVAAAVGLGFAYWVTQAAGLSLGRAGHLAPLLAAWAGPVLFSVLAALLLFRAERV